jgi:hypothetical protein
MTLTHEQIDAMEAGREMDALVAELVMGWTEIHKHDEMGWSGIGPNGPSNNSWRTLPSTMKSISKNVCTFKMEKWPYANVRKYSTDIAAAWQVVERFDRRLVDIDIRSDTQDDGELWGAGFIEYFEEGEGFKAIGSAAADTAPLAICRAALKAVINDSNI